MSAPAAVVEAPSAPMPIATRVIPASAPNLNLWSRIAFRPFSVRMINTILETLAPILQAEAARGHAVDGGWTPIIGTGAHHQHPTAAGGAQDETSLDQFGDNQHALGIRHEFGGVGKVLAA